MIEAIQSSGYQSVWVVTGGGSGAVHAMLSHPGASRFILEAQIPYSAAALLDYLGQPPDGYCSAQCARVLAEKAFARAVHLAPDQNKAAPLIGIACTAALQTTRRRRGSDRAHFCIHSGEQETHQMIELAAGSRADQEWTVSDALLRFVASCLGVPE